MNDDPAQIPTPLYPSGDTLLDRIGWTPPLRLPSSDGIWPRVAVPGKAEWFNPGGSVKDQAACRMIDEAEASGDLGPGKTILDATSGNTGIAYAWIGAANGYPVKLAVPANASPERKRLLKTYGAEVVYTDPLGGIDTAIEKVREINNASPDRYFYPKQYDNRANWLARCEGTAAEIWAQTAGAVTHFVGGGEPVIEICPRLLEAIQTHGGRSYPEECCGALIGSEGDGARHVDAVLLLDNRRGGTSAARRRYLVTAEDFRELERVTRERGAEIVGFYHSHPDHPPIPSDFDREHALPWYAYLIVPVSAGGAGAPQGWILSDDRSRFDALPIVRLER